MSGDVPGLSAVDFDGLLIEEVEVVDGLAVVGVVDGAHILHHVDFSRRLRVYLCESLLQFPESGILVNFYY